MKEKWDVKKVNFGERTLFQLKIGRNTIWVSPKLITKTENGFFLELPVENVSLGQGRRNLVLRPGDRNLFNVFVRCAQYSMSSWDESSITIDTYPCEIFAYESDTNHHAALVLTDTSFVEYRWKRARGQTVEEGFGVVHLDGTVTEVEGEKEDALVSLD
jgi:hypothetical protein